jgi:serine/threonine-protein kinase
MGVVYRAQDPAIGRTVAIKTIRLSDLTDSTERERLRERLFREAQSAGILSHPNIVTIYDVFEENGLAYIFMEMVNGPTLEKLLTSDRVPTGTAIVSILRQTAAALDYAHKKGIVHRDIKPANIMIDGDGTAKITDFGVARIESSQLTQSGTMMGTPSYMSPEQVQGTGIDGRADEFALGVIAYEVLTGEKPFVAEYLPSLLYKIVREDPVPPQRINPTLGPEVEAVIRRALAKTPADRYPTSCEFINELEAACNLRPGWVVLGRGKSQVMPTLASASLIVPEPEPPRLEETRPVRVPVPAPVPPPPAVSVPARAPVRDVEESHTLRNVVLALAAVVLLIVVVLVMQRNSEAPSTQTTAEAVKPPVADSQDAAEAGKAAEPDKQPQTQPEKPSPAPTDEQKSQEKPEETKPPADKGAQAAPAESLVRKTPSSTAAGQPVQVITSPGGAKVSIDGAEVCTSPCSQPLPKGRHVITARLEGFREARRIIETPDDSNLTIDLDRITGTLSVSSTPPGATIILNGQARAEKTPTVMKLPVGSYRLQVVRDDQKTDEEVVAVTDGGMAQRRYKLE